MVKRTKVIKIDVTPNQFRDSIQRQNRNLAWTEIVPELVDNSIEHSFAVCNVRVTWDIVNGEQIFKVQDDGYGSTNINVFFEPGKSLPPATRKGNSTFGMGLYNIECCLSSSAKPSKMNVVTAGCDGTIYTASRTIQEDQDSQWYDAKATQRKLESYGFKKTGTIVSITGFQKPSPRPGELKNLADNLGLLYSDVMRHGGLRIELRCKNETIEVKPAPVPDVAEMKSAIVRRGDHVYEIEWGVTKTTNNDNGVRLVYGPRLFNITTEPFVKLRKKHLTNFYAKVRVPLSDGKNVMDQIKRNASDDLLQSVYEECNSLWAEELQASDWLGRISSNREITDTVSNMLTSVLVKPERNGTKPRNRAKHNRNGSSSGIAPKGTGGKRTAKEREGEQVETEARGPEVDTYFGEYGDSFGVAQYDHEGGRVTFNEYIDRIRRLREQKMSEPLFMIAIGHIAAELQNDARQEKFGMRDMNYTQIMEEFMLRAKLK